MTLPALDLRVELGWDHAVGQRVYRDLPQAQWFEYRVSNPVMAANGSRRAASELLTLIPDRVGIDDGAGWFGQVK